MNEEEGKEERVPEVEAAWDRLMAGYLNLRGPIERRSVRGVRGGLSYIGRWLGVVEAKDVAAAFRKEALRDLDLLFESWAKVEPEVVVKEGTSLKALFPELSTRAHNALCRSRALAKAVGIAEDDRRPPYVEEIVGILKDESRGEKFLLWDVRLFGPVALAELKAALVAKGFLPAEETESE